MMPALPRYYVLPGHQLPLEIRQRPGYAAGLATGPGQGPDVVGDDPDPAKRQGGGGTLYGGSYVHGELGWVPWAEGIWASFIGVRPQYLLRLRPSPRVQAWVDVPGVEPEQVWRVPVLLRSVKTEAGPTIYLSALDQTWNGTAFVDDGPLAAMQERLFLLSNNIKDPACNQDSLELVGDLVCEALAIGHMVGRQDHVAAGWLTQHVFVGVINALIGLG